ncbi:Crp/Fnr family transcriptional regulator [Flavobacterium sp. Fl-77]|uniref:Crp/Fnr family transcriptional regulator n=1 Tax=Flavobacterium flavipigmentatum TaxID=2893884 RepID=A0AAJ2SFH8_9FLAO|nr:MULTISPECIES: Crp/Fnr family transcriptional regulator [unclassified Flavobacterium]MDX6183938.1 Crp/Fnr family transcriptional regulator [Flavobacterium sp. Fl-33]MDX6187496.1 Crp/Fnr family transcriptional regulator [Flavobacterium sp. Fl-77]UFH37665.1 Crp/Fnr family transcriptional regulator [Flavobacterium sp. F-70]
MQENLKKHIEKIVTLTIDEIDMISSLFSEKKYKKNQFLIKESEMVNEAYYIVSGLVKLNYTDDLGKVHIISFAMEDWWESDFNAYFTRTRSTMSLQCIEDTEVLCLPIENYEFICAKIPKMQQFLIKLSNSGFIASQQRIISLLTNNAQERYHQLLSKYPTLIQRVPKNQLALYLGVSRETLSRFSS